MANSLVVLLSYIDNILWLSTRLVYGIIFIFELNYRLVIAIFKGCVQLWSISIQGLVLTGHASVATIEFLADLPLRSYHLGRYLLSLSSSIVYDAVLNCLSWSWTNFVSCVQSISATMVNLSVACFGAWTYILESSLSALSQYADALNSVISGSIAYARELKENTGLVLHSATLSIHKSLLYTANGIIKGLISGVGYPITFAKVVFNSLIKYSEDLVEMTLLTFDAGHSYIISGLDDILLLLNRIASYPVVLFHQIANTFDALLDGAVEGCASFVAFAFKNWYAVIALGLCLSLLASITIYLNVQQERNLQSTLQDLTHLVASFTRSVPRQDAERQHARHEGHLQAAPHQQEGDPLPRDPVQQEPNENDPNLEAQGGGGDGFNQHQNRPNHHSAYNFRSRNFTPVGESSSDSSSVENIVSKLKNRLGEEQERQLCVVCQDSLKNTLFLPCRHLCVCLGCAETIVSSEAPVQRHCPLCRSRIGTIVEVYT